MELNTEIKEYVERIQQGVFYEHLYRMHNNRKKAPVNKYDLNKYKVNLFKNLFFSDVVSGAEAKKASRIFNQVYPKISEILDKIKNEKGYKEVARTLQGYESDVMNEAITRLKSTYGTEFYLRFHDAILCKEKQCPLVSEVLYGVLLESVDVAGNVKSGTWGVSFEKVLNSLNLHIMSTKKKLKFDAAVGKEKNKIIRSMFKSPIFSVEDRSKKWQSFLHFYDTDPSNQSRVEKMEQEYKSFRFIYPSNWDLLQIQSFKKFSLFTIEEHFKKNAEWVSGELGWIGKSNLERFRKELTE